MLYKIGGKFKHIGKWNLQRSCKGQTTTAEKVELSGKVSRCGIDNFERKTRPNTSAAWQ
jgi:hypothetical protein